MAGMAMMAPIGTATRPASRSDSSQGIPKLWAKCPMAAAPTAAKPYWQSETCPEIRTSRPRDRIRITSTSPDEKTASLAPTRLGTSANTTTAIRPNPTRIRAGA